VSEITTPEKQKQFATLQAKAAIALVELHRIESDTGRPSYVATQWAVTLHFQSLDDVAEWLVGFDTKAVSEGAQCLSP
jgi:hypothetical protein